MPNDMAHHYIPILKAKPGEIAAIRSLSTYMKSQLLPLFELVPAPQGRDGLNAKLTSRSSVVPAKTTEVRAKEQCKAIAKAWALDSRILLDTHFLKEQADQGMAWAMSYFDREAKQISVVPVCNLDSAMEHLSKAASLCLRLRTSDLYDPLCQKRVGEFVNRSALSPHQLDLLVDCGYIQGGDARVHEISLALKDGLPKLSALMQWRSFSLAGGSFPASLAGLGPEYNSIQRLEWAIWSQVTGSLSLRKNLLFADYGIQNPSLPSGGFAGYSNIRYASKSHWIVLKGQLLGARHPKAKKEAEYRHLCSVLTNNEQFCGKDFSFADEYIADCANGIKTPSIGLARWREVGTSHHLHFVVEQLSSQAASSASV